MENVFHKTVRLLAAAGGAVAGLFGGWSSLLTVLTALMGRSRKTEYGGLSSKVGAQGLARKGLMMLVVLVAALLDQAMGAETAVCRDAACWFYIANEGLSLMENLSLAGVPFPPRLKRLLGQHLEEEKEDDHGSQS